MSPPQGAWTVRTWWLGIPGEPTGDIHPTTDRAHEAWEPARKEALNLCCCAGTVAVVLYDPYGDVVGHWDRFSNVAHHLSADPAEVAMAALTQAAWDDERKDRARVG